jgi:ribonuclease Y
MDATSYILLAALGVVSTVTVFLIIYLISVRTQAKEIEKRRVDAERKLREARRDGEDKVKEALNEAKRIAIKETREFERDQKDKTGELSKLEKRFQKREEQLDRKAATLTEKEEVLRKQSELVEREEERAAQALKNAERILKESQQKLENVAGLSLDEARELLKESILTEVRQETASEVRQIEDEARRTAEERSKSIIATALQRMTNEFVADACVSVVALPSDDMKGRIIGREGRNIRAIEQATGVDLIIDDTPEAVILSCFNPVRREIAKVSIERLLADGRVHPARIDEIVQKVKAEYDQMIQEAGERAGFEVGIQGLHPEIVRSLGTLKFMTSANQSILQHSVETAQIAGILAAELDLNVRVAKRAGLLHDIGKAFDETIEGNHAEIGADFLKKLGEAPEVVEAVRRHHVENLQGVNPLAVVVQAANSLSSFRPGARKDFLEKAIGRMRELEGAVAQVQGIEQVYVVKAGREVRALVSPSVFDDSAVTTLAKTVARRIRDDLRYPGPVKVTMVREQRSTHLAK